MNVKSFSLLVLLLFCNYLMAQNNSNTINSLPLTNFNYSNSHSFSGYIDEPKTSYCFFSYYTLPKLVKIKLANNDYVYETQTDSNGKFTITNIPNGNYNLTLSAENFVTVNTYIVISNFSVTDYEIALPIKNNWRYYYSKHANLKTIDWVKGINQDYHRSRLNTDANGKMSIENIPFINTAFYINGVRTH